MKIGIIGLPQTGKKTLFRLLTQYVFSEKDLVANKSVKSFASIKDPRFEHLVEMYKPKKQVRAKIDIELLPKLEPETIRKGDIFKDIAEFDAVCHVVRAFKNESVYHINGSVDYERDIESVNSELILNDLLFIEKRIERIDNNLKKVKDAAVVKEKELLLKLKAQLDKALPLRLLDLSTQEMKSIASYPFVTRKKMLIILNISEDEINKKEQMEQLKQKYQDLDVEIIQICAKVESEIARLETKQERDEFLELLGIREPAIDVLTRLFIKVLNLISFFTVGPDEVRQWLIRAGSTAPDAAGIIHSDLQKGFIRAEVMKYDELMSAGSEADLKQAGKSYLKGKDYIVEDGDIINIRFNV